MANEICASRMCDKPATHAIAARLNNPVLLCQDCVKGIADAIQERELYIGYIVSVPNEEAQDGAGTIQGQQFCENPFCLKEAAVTVTGSHGFNSRYCLGCAESFYDATGKPLPGWAIAVLLNC